MMHGQTIQRSRAALVALLVGFATPVGLVLAPPAAAVHLEQYIEVPQCTPPSGQDCAQSPEVKFTAGQNDSFRAQFTANANHCSDLLVRFNVDNHPQSDWLRVGPSHTVCSGYITRSGDRVLSVTGKGILDGCNTGVSNSWGGTVRIDFAEVAVIPVGPAPKHIPPPCKWTYTGAPVIEQDNGLRVGLDSWDNLTAIGPPRLFKRGATVQSNRGELIGAGGDGTHVSFTIAWFYKNNYVTTNDYRGEIDPQWGSLRGTTVDNDGSVKNTAREHFTCSQ